MDFYLLSSKCGWISYIDFEILYVDFFSNRYGHAFLFNRILQLTSIPQPPTTSTM